MKTAKKLQYTIEPPVFSWDKPIEDEILTYVRAMKRSWQGMVHGSIWPHVRSEAKSIVMAYESVEEHIVGEIELRKKMAKLKKVKP